MRIKALIIFAAYCKLSSGQDLSSVFLDSLKITINGEKVIESNISILKFIPNNIDGDLKMFDNGIYQLKLKFSTVPRDKYSYLALSGLSFFKNNAEISVIYGIQNRMHSEYCSNSLSENSVHRNWGKNSVDTAAKIEVKVHYRLVSLAPVDTLNYRYNFREGLWTGRDHGVEKVLVNYKNDRKEGVAKAVYSDGSSFTTIFNNNSSKNYDRGSFQNTNPYRSAYILPNIVTHSCNTEKRIYHRSFYFESEKEIYDISSGSTLRVLFQDKGLVHDSIDYEVVGRFVTMVNDTIVIDAMDMNVHDFYKQKDDTLHDYYKEIPGGFAVIPLKSVLYISYKRKKYFLKPTEKNNKIWKIEYDTYD